LAPTNGLTAINHLHEHEQSALIQVWTGAVKESRSSTSWVLPVSFETSRDRADEVGVTGVQLQRMTHINPLDTDRIRTWRNTTLHRCQFVLNKN